MRERQIDTLFYEVVDRSFVMSSQTYCMDIDSVLEYLGPRYCENMGNENYSEYADEEQEKDDEVEEIISTNAATQSTTVAEDEEQEKQSALVLNSLRTLTSSSGAKMKKSKGKKRSGQHGKKNLDDGKKQRVARNPVGWSYKPPHTQRTGRLPLCHGCNFRMERNQGRLIHNIVRKGRHTSSFVRHYHCRKKCLQNINSEDLDDLIDKVWSATEVVLLVKNMM